MGLTGLSRRPVNLINTKAKQKHKQINSQNLAQNEERSEKWQMPHIEEIEEFHAIHILREMNFSKRPCLAGMKIDFFW